MIETMSPVRAEAFKELWSDRMFMAILKNVRTRFLNATGLTTITGQYYPVVCLLLSQAMSEVVGGYSGGSSCNNDLFNEALGFSEARELNTGLFDYAHDSLRYSNMIITISELQKTQPKFATIVDNFISGNFE